MMAQYESFPAAAATSSLRERDRSPHSTHSNLSEGYLLNEDGALVLRSPPKRNSSLGRKHQVVLRDADLDQDSFSDELINRFDTLRIHMRWEYEIEKEKRVSSNTFDNWQSDEPILIPSPENKLRNPIPSFEPPTINKNTSVVSRILNSASSSFSGIPSARTPSQRSASSVERHRNPIPSFEPPTPTPAPVTSISTSAAGDSLFVSSPSTHSATNGFTTTTAPLPPLPPAVPPKVGPYALALATSQSAASGPKKIEKLKYQIDQEADNDESSDRPPSSGKLRRSFMGKLFSGTGTIRSSKSTDHLSDPKQKALAPTRASAPPAPRSQASDEPAPNVATSHKSDDLHRAKTNEPNLVEIDDNVPIGSLQRFKPYEPQLSEPKITEKTLIEDDDDDDDDDDDHFISTNVHTATRSRSKLATIDSDSSSGSLRLPRPIDSQPGSFRGRTTDHSSSQHSSSPYDTLISKNFLDEDEPIALIRNALAGISPAPSPTPGASGSRPIPSNSLAPPEPVYDERPTSSQGQAFSYARTQPTPASPLRPVSANGRVEDTQGRSMWGMFGKPKRRKEKGKQEEVVKVGRRSSAKSTDEHSVVSEPTKKLVGTMRRKTKKEKEGRKVGWCGTRGKPERVA